jgi:hypothetical protein
MIVFQETKHGSVKLAFLALGLGLATIYSAATVSAHTINRSSTDAFYGLLDANGEVMDSDGHIRGHLTEGRGGITVSDTAPDPSKVSKAVSITIDQRLRIMRTALATSLSSNWIDINEFDRFNSKLDDIVKDKDKIASDGFTFDEGIKVGRELDDLNDTLTSSVKFQVVSPVVVTINGAPRVAVTARPPL